MNIKGIVPVTTIDFPNHIAATFFTGGCNMRCPFCHNADLVTNLKNLPTFDEEYISEFLRKRKGFLEGICITGGEPTLHKELPDFIRMIKSHGFKVKLDSNGTNPEMLELLIKENLLDYIAMDVKQCKEKYSYASGKKVDLQLIEESIKLIKESSIEYEFRTTVLPQIHSKEDILKIGAWLKGTKRFSLQRFVPAKKMFDMTLTQTFSEEELLALAVNLRANIVTVEVK